MPFPSAISAYSNDSPNLHDGPMISVIIPAFRATEDISSLIDALRSQTLPEGECLEIILVDDGSGDSSLERLRTLAGGDVRLLELPHNMGRSAARNAGAEVARGDYLVFVDSDCRPQGDLFLANHIVALRQGSVATCGPVTGLGTDFWSTYQQDASRRRAQMHASGFQSSGSTQNCAVTAAAFRSAGGFDISYVDYGFEDRDLFTRLARLGQVTWCTDALIVHLDRLDLPAVVGKLMAAGGRSAIRFSRDHPDAYRQLGYAAIDTRLHPALRPVAHALAPILGAAAALDRLLDKPWMPYTLAKIIVKAFSALAFMHGTSKLA